MSLRVDELVHGAAPGTYLRNSPLLLSGGAPLHRSPLIRGGEGGGGEAPATFPPHFQGGSVEGRAPREQKRQIPEIRSWGRPMDELFYTQTNS